MVPNGYLLSSGWTCFLGPHQRQLLPEALKPANLGLIRKQSLAPIQQLQRSPLIAQFQRGSQYRLALAVARAARRILTKFLHRRPIATLLVESLQSIHRIERSGVDVKEIPVGFDRAIDLSQLVEASLAGADQERATP